MPASKFSLTTVVTKTPKFDILGIVSHRARKGMRKARKSQTV